MCNKVRKIKNLNENQSSLIFNQASIGRLELWSTMPRFSIKHFILESTQLLPMMKMKHWASKGCPEYVQNVWSNDLLALQTANVKSALQREYHRHFENITTYTWNGFFPIVSQYFQNINRTWKHHDKSEKLWKKHGGDSRKSIKILFTVFYSFFYSIL